MYRLLLPIFLFVCLPLLGFCSMEEYSDIDTVYYLEHVSVTAIKQGVDLKQEPLSASLISRSKIDSYGITDLKGVSTLSPNFYMPDYGSRTTSSIYVRGLGARIDNPVIGLNVDNVPILSKDNFDFEMADIERIEVLRGPQSTMYGRNTMAGAINIYTISPFNYQGIRASVSYGSGESYKLRASYYGRSDNFAYALSGYYTQESGLWENQYDNQKLDWEKLGGARLRLQWQTLSGFNIDNTLSFSMLNQGGYAYQQMDGEINYNDNCGFDRMNLSNGLTISKDFENFAFSSITSYQYTDNALELDNDFTVLDYFTLNQDVREHALTQDVIFRSRESQNKYSWLFGVFGFAESSKTDAPVNFKQDGISDLILDNANEYNPQYSYAWLEDNMLLECLFDIPTVGASVYHKSSFELGRWRFSAELRLDYEYSSLDYTNIVSTAYRATDKYDQSVQYDVDLDIYNNDFIDQSFLELLPKLSVVYTMPDRGMFYGSFSKGYKAGGFNTQMFSDVLQSQLMYKMGVGTMSDVEEIISYKPEYSYNYELGGNIAWPQVGLASSFALFYIDCKNQQLTVFPDGMTTGRMMTNAGKTRSYGLELSVQKSIAKNLMLNLDYGYTNAKFVDYDDGTEQYAGKYVPYAPSNTLSLRADYNFALWKGDIVLGAGYRGVGDIYWEQTNSIVESFYGLWDASVAYKTSGYSLAFKMNNMTNTSYNTFYFESIENEFVQKGNPRTFSITLNINI